ncbi:MAG TPA: undecaprenyldiphospho-muramoylpentapeptide beta-N-acetylglucosaminyltransferase [Verrucomicrobiae bacterium]|nr:undecaprenyldiphospho-muramoylpentapeptide beta-N-acetylglucosaminyltransferase [Verrucomicrobiae bacterium]
MTFPKTNTPCVAIACGGTGGHLFPGLAVAAQLKQRGCDVTLLISPKEVDQQAVKSARDVEVFTLPALALQNGNYFSFGAGFLKSFLASRKIFNRRRPVAVLAMGGFTSAPPVFAAKDMSVKTFLHESNTVPGRANRILSRFVDGAFVGFPEAAGRLKTRKVVTTGTPVRPQFQSRDTAHCRTALGLDAGLPTILIVGGSQGAHGLNEMMLSALPLLAEKNWQWLHLTGAKDFEKVKAAYDARGMKAVVKPFLAEMDLVLGTATAAVSRAGASSLAELAAMRLPALLVPFPAAAHNHQYFNASAFEKTGAAKLIEQKKANPEGVAAVLSELVENNIARSEIQNALAQWHEPRAAERIADAILLAVAKHQNAASQEHGCGCGCAHGRTTHATS